MILPDLFRHENVVAMSVLSFSEYKRSGDRLQNAWGDQQVFHLPVAPQVTARTRFASSLPRRVRFLMPEEAVVLLEEAMEISEGNKKEAARLLNLKRTTLLEKIKKKTYPGSSEPCRDMFKFMHSGWHQ